MACQRLLGYFIHGSKGSYLYFYVVVSYEDFLQTVT